MCYFLTISVPAKHEALVANRFGRGFGVIETKNASLQAAFPQSNRMFLLTSGMCSCDLYFDAKFAGPLRNPESRAAKLRADYQRRGWSATKIERAIEQSLALQSFKPPPSGLRTDVRMGLAEVFAAAGEGGIFAHFYSEDIESVRFQLMPRFKWTLEQFREGETALPTDTIVLVKLDRKN